MHSEQVDFVIHTGNFVERAGSAEQWGEFFRVAGPLLSSVPLFPTLGPRDFAPHDGFERWFVTVLWNDTLPYYFQDWGNLRVVTASAGLACGDGCLEASFIRRALAEGAARGQLLVLVSALPVYSSGSSSVTSRFRAQIVRLAHDHGVEVVLSGGSEYERSKPIGGTTYVVTGSAGAPRQVLRPRTFSEVLRVEPSYVVFDVSPQRLELRAVGVSGNVIDAAVVAAVPPRAASSGATAATRSGTASTSASRAAVDRGLVPWP